MYSAMFLILGSWNRGEKASGTMLDKISRQPHRVSPEECKRLYRLLEQEMKRNKSYRNPNLKVADLAVDFDFLFNIGSLVGRRIDLIHMGTVQSGACDLGLIFAVFGRFRHIGYPDSAMTLDICIPDRSWYKWIYSLVALLLAAAGVYVFRRSLLRVVWAVLRKLNGFNDAEIPTVVEEGKKEEEAEEVVTPEIEPLTEEETAAEPIEPKSEKKTASSADDKYRTNKVSPEECKRLYRLLEQEMKRNKSYRNPNLKVADLAVAIGTSSHSLSYLFNQYLEKNYYDYINEYRVEEFKSLILKDEYAKYTLTAMAEYCGFSSRASFFRTFKKLAGITPNEYIKQVSGEHRPVD